MVFIPNILASFCRNQAQRNKFLLTYSNKFKSYLHVSNYIIIMIFIHTVFGLPSYADEIIQWYLSLHDHSLQFDFEGQAYINIKLCLKIHEIIGI